MPIPSNHRILKLRCLLIIFFSVLINADSIISQTLNYPIKQVNGVDCYVYKVQQSEGFYRIGVNFNTTEAIIRSFNPHVTDGLQANMEIYIPVQKKLSSQMKYIEHVVEKRQTVFRIRRMYDITEDELLEHNPQIQNKSLRVGEKLRIPVLSEPEVATPQNSTDIQQEAPEPQQPVENIQKEQTKQPETYWTQKTEKLNIAFLLPFMLDFKQELSDSRFVEFYAGALIAIQEAKKKGINFNIHTYDVERSDLKIMEVLQDSTLRTMDLIIGPAYSNQISIVGDFARMHKIKTLIPFSSKIIDLETNPYIYQFNPGQDVELNKLKEILKDEHLNSNIIFAEIKNANTQDDGYILMRALKNFLNEKNIPYATTLLNQDSIHHIRQTLNPLKDNLIFFNTNRINQLGVYLRELKALSHSVNLKIYEPYSWRISKTEKPRSFYLSVFKNVYAERAYDSYTNNFSTLFDWSPSNELPRYDLLGYDLMSYFFKTILSMKQAPAVSYPIYEGIQSDLKFEKSSARGGYINKTLNHFE